MDAHHPSRVSGTPRERRSALREERHPNAVTAPPVQRGSMPRRPWRGFWHSVAAATLSAGTRLLPKAGAAPGARRGRRRPCDAAPPSRC
jgi:membrane glycosyltransferase